MPVRFVSPSLGGKGETYLASQSWQLGIAYRRLNADEWIVGHDVVPANAPGAQPVRIDVHSIILSASYALSERVAITLNVPISTGRISRIFPPSRGGDGQRHETSAAGLGEINLIGTIWLGRPSGSRDRNLGVGLGVKAPTGRHDIEDDFWLASSTIRFPVDQSIQLGDGGWGIIMQMDGFQQIFSRGFAFASANYTAHPRERTDVLRDPLLQASDQPFYVGVPDVFGVRAGIAVEAWPDQGLSASLGWRVDGTMRRDLFGGRDLAFRRPAIAGYIDPGLSLARGRDRFTVSVPVRAYKNFRRSYADVERGRPGGGDLANRLIFAEYTRRF